MTGGVVVIGGRATSGLFDLRPDVTAVPERGKRLTGSVHHRPPAIRSAAAARSQPPRHTERAAPHSTTRCVHEHSPRGPQDADARPRRPLPQSSYCRPDPPRPRHSVAPRLMRPFVHHPADPACRSVTAPRTAPHGQSAAQSGTRLITINRAMPSEKGRHFRPVHALATTV
jgi:hypothetical protein